MDEENLIGMLLSIKEREKGNIDLLARSGLRHSTIRLRAAVLEVMVNNVNEASSSSSSTTINNNKSILKVMTKEKKQNSNIRNLKRKRSEVEEILDTKSNDAITTKNQKKKQDNKYEINKK